jgi:hypothetical protein
MVDRARGDEEVAIDISDKISSCWRPAATTSAPADNASLATAAPIPEVPPTTTMC